MSNDRKTVLIADDEPSTLALLGRHLRSRGYQVLEASDGDEAWELAHEHLPDLVILDVMMPGMSGWEVCRRIREAVSLAHTGVIMLTGIGETLNEMTSPLYGADAHVDKPFEFAVLDQQIRDTLERRQAGALGRPDEVAEEVRVALPRALSRPKAAAKPDDATPDKPKPATKKPAKAKAKPAAKAKAKSKAKPAAKAPAKAKSKAKSKAKPAAKAKAKSKAKPVPKAKAKAKSKATAKTKAKAGKPKPKSAPKAKAAAKIKAGKPKPKKQRSKR